MPGVLSQKRGASGGSQLLWLKHLSQHHNPTFSSESLASHRKPNFQELRDAPNFHAEKFLGDVLRARAIAERMIWES